MGSSKSPGFVDKDTFLKRLPEVFESTKTKRAVWITHKRLTYDGSDTAMAAPSNVHDDRIYPCILKVTDGCKWKMSTHVYSTELESFHSSYGALLKLSMSNLKKRDKKKEKARHELAILRRKRLEQEIVIVGPKRGAGRRKRQRRIIAAFKQGQERQRQAERDEIRTKKQAHSS